jgi:hypothetical protein
VVEREKMVYGGLNVGKSDNGLGWVEWWKKRRWCRLG